MGISIKSGDEIALMRKAGEIVANTHLLLEKEIRAGITTKELDRIAEEYIRSQGAIPSFKGYHGYPGSINTSINEEVIHGIPGLRKLKDGDIISIDIGAMYKGYHGDAARTHPVGQVSEEALRLIAVTKQSFFEGIRFAKAGCHLFEISGAIQSYVESNGFSVVREWVGHGVGSQLHEDPEIPNYKPPSRGPRLAAGMTFAVEPMVNVGGHATRVLSDNWTVVTMDKKWSAHYENTILLKDGEPEILTLRN